MNLNSRRGLWSRRLSFLVLSLASVVVPGTPALAHQSAWEATAPNGRSPFYAPYSFKLSGYHYGEGTHVDYSGSTHNNDYYAVDLVPVVDGSVCNRYLYPIWNNLRVTGVDRANGTLTMEGAPVSGGRVHQLQYRHMEEIRVNLGDAVGKSTWVGRVGSRGNSSGCHLHLSTRAKFSTSESVHAGHGHPYFSRRTVICGKAIANTSTAYPGCSS